MIFDRRWGQCSYLALFLFSIAILSVACTKPTSIGKDFIGDLDGQDLVYSDTVTVQTRSVVDDSLITYNQSRQLVGSMEDPLIGRSYAGVFFQIRLPRNNIDLGTGLQFDSAILQMQYESVYGDAAASHDLAVYQMTEDIYLDTAYRNYEHFNYDPVEVGRISNFQASSSDTNLIRIRLNRSFGEKLLNQSGTNNYAGNGNFLQFMKGLYLAPDTTGGFSNSIITLNLLSSTSRVVLYYSNSAADSLSFPLLISSASARNLYLSHSYPNNQRIREQITHQVEQDSLVYAQGMAGLAVKLTFPWLENLGAANIVKAELVMTRIPHTASYDTVYTAPDLIVPRVRLDQPGPFFGPTIDEQFTLEQGQYSVGGELKEEMKGVKVYERYRINLVWEIQRMLDTKDFDRPLYLKIVPSILSPSRIQLGGGSHPNPEYRMKLNLYYTKNK